MHVLLLIILLIGSTNMRPAEAAEPPSAKSEPPAYELQQVINLALERNPAVAVAQGAIEQSRGQRIEAGAYPNPSILGQSGSGSIRDPSTGTTITEYAVTLGQPLEWPAMRHARQRAADAGLAGANAGLAEASLKLIADVKIAFYELLLAQRESELAKQNLEIVGGVSSIVKTRVKLGEAPQFEAIKAEVEVLKANQLVTRAENTVRVNRVVLDTLTAGALGPAYAIKGDFGRFPHELALEPLTMRALEQHPTIRRLTQLIEKADRTVEFERQARVPNVTVNGGYWREAGREAVTANLVIPMPIWYQRQGEITSALGAKRKEEAEWLKARNDFLRLVNQHFQDAQTTAHLIDVFEKGLLKQAREALRIAQFSFQQGASSLLEVLDAQRVQRQILLDYTQAQFGLSVSLARLERAVGGPL